jgi:tetratricopeptide (TPR) repeat protein
VRFLRAFLLGCLCLLSTTAWCNPAVESRIESLSSYIKAKPLDAYLYVQRGLAYSENNQPELALADIKKAEQVGTPVDAAMAHGILSYRAGDFDDAREHFDLYLKTYPDNTAALEYRSRVLRDSGEFSAALADYRQLIASGATLNPGYHIAAAEILADLPGSGNKEAIALLDARMEELGNITQLQRYAIALEREQGNYEAALQRLASLEAKQRSTPEWHLDVAEVLIENGRRGEAAAYLEMAEERLNKVRATRAREKTRQRLEQLSASLD